MEPEAWAKLVTMVGLPIVILFGLAYAGWRAAWSFSSWAEPHINMLIKKAGELIDVLIDFHQSTKERLANIEEAQGLTNQKVFDIHSEIMKTKNNIRPQT